MSTILKRTKNAVRRPGKKAAEPNAPDEAIEAEDVEEDVLDDEHAAEDPGQTGEPDDADDVAEDDEDEDFEFEDDDDDDEEVAPDLTRVRQVLAILAVVALILSGAVFYLLVQVRHAQAANEAGDVAVSMAGSDAEHILSYDYRTLDTNFQQSVALTTGGFRTQYQQTTSQLVRPQALKEKVIVQASTRDAGLISASDNNAVVLVFVDRITTKAGQQKPTFNQDRVRMTMTKVNGKWLVSKLDAL